MSTSGPKSSAVGNLELSGVHDIFERRYKDRVLAQAVDSLAGAERDLLLHQIDSLARRLDTLIEATRKVREPLSFDLLLTRAQ